MSEPVPFLLRTLAPVHLGCDEVYEPLGFVIHPDRQKLVAFEPADFLMRLSEPDRRHFLEICRRGTVDSILEIYRFYHQHRHLAQGREVAVCPGLVAHYQQVVNLRPGARDLQRALNQFAIYRTAFLTADHRPFVPGSAVKGALRTAYLNAMAAHSPMPTPKGEKGRFDPQKLERRLLEYEKIPQDPFRLLKVSDFLPLGEVKTRIVYAVNEKKKVSQFAARGPYQILEVIEPGAEFLGTITLETLPPEVRQLSAIRHFLDWKKVAAAARSFYLNEKKREDQELFEIGLGAQGLDIPGEWFPLRLGRHSGAECVTIAGHRHIKILQAQGQPPKTLDQATTLWLAADFHQRDKRPQASLRPFGWVSLAKLTLEDAAILKEQEAAWRQNVVAGATLKPTAPPAPQDISEPVAKPLPLEEVWEGATLTWNPGKGEVTAVWQGKKAYGKGKDLVPEVFHKKLFKDRKAVISQVIVTPIGNAYKIKEIKT